MMVSRRALKLLLQSKWSYCNIVVYLIELGSRVVHCAMTGINLVTTLQCHDILIACHYGNSDITVTIKKIIMEIINLYSPY
jgi:hypothetical protein